MKCYFCAILNQMCKNRMEQEHQFIDYIEQSIIKNWDKDALTDYKGITLQYKDVARKIAKFHIVLESAGIQPGDKIAVCGRNSAHWGVTFLATITYGAVIVPILHEFKADNIHNIVNHSEAKLLFVGDQAWENLNEDAMPLLEGIASLTDFTALVSRNEKLTYAFEHRNAIYGQRYPKNFRPEHICYRKDRPEELAIINYTSGTTGYSKGVMLPYRSIWSNVAYCFRDASRESGRSHRFHASDGSCIRHGIRFLIWFLCRSAHLLPDTYAVSEDYCAVFCRNKAKSDLLCTFDRRENYQKRYSSESGQQNR